MTLRPLDHFCHLVTALLSSRENRAKAVRALLISSSIPLLLSVGPAQAELQISRADGTVTLHCERASIGEVLDGLQMSFGFLYETSAPLDEQITGTYSGSLRDVLSALLRERDHVIHTSDGKVKRVVFGRIRAAAPVVADPLRDRAPGPRAIPPQKSDRPRLVKDL